MVYELYKATDQTIYKKGSQESCHPNSSSLFQAKKVISIDILFPNVKSHTKI